MKIITETDETPYALIMIPFYEDGAMNVRVGVAIPDDVENSEAEAMGNIMTLLYASFDLMNKDTSFLATVRAHQESLMLNVNDYASEAVEEEVKFNPTYEYLDEEKKVIKLDFTTRTQGNA